MLNRRSQWQPQRGKSGERMTFGMVSVGYEGRELEPFVAVLRERGVTVLADVRLNAISRRRGFSKTRLRERLSEAGIEYLHLRCLGNPKENRDPFRTGRVTEGKRVFAELMEGEAAQAALDELSRRTQSELVAVMCFEADHTRCHRQVVADMVRDRVPVPLLEV
jgi:uncharacterized protein (DUF488 family)